MRTYNHEPRSGGHTTPRGHGGPLGSGREPRQATTLPRTRSWLLDLQRSVGNRAITELLRLSQAGLALQRANGGAPAPTLSAQVHPRGEEGKCGNFSRVRNWQLANPVQGLIIQRVTRTFNVEQRMPDGTWSPIAGQALDAYVTDQDSSVHATVGQYWELWTVDAHGNVSDEGDDTFALCSLILDENKIHDTTRGSFVISGLAHFYPTLIAPAVLGFGQNAVAAAGGLFSRITDPTADLQQHQVAAAGVPPVTYTVTVTWNSADKRKNPNKKRKSEEPYTPTAAWSTVAES